MNCLQPWVICNLAIFAKFTLAGTIIMFVRRDRLSSKRVNVEEHRFVIIITQKGYWHFFQIRIIVNQQEIVNLLIFANRHFPRKMDILVCLFVNDCFNWYHKCGRQIVLFTVVVVETCEIPLFIFLKRSCYCWRNIWNCYVNVAKIFFLTLSFYSTFSEYSYYKAQWSKDTCQMQSGRNGHRGTGCKA